MLEGSSVLEGTKGVPAHEETANRHNKRIAFFINETSIGWLEELCHKEGEVGREWKRETKADALLPLPNWLAFPLEFQVMKPSMFYDNKRQLFFFRRAYS